MCQLLGEGNVDESKAEINPFFRRSVIIYEFWGFWYFQVFSIDWARSYCGEYFSMLKY